MIWNLKTIFIIGIFQIVGSFNTILGQGDGGDQEGLVVPKSYSNLRIPSGRRRFQASPAFAYAPTPPIKVQPQSDFVPPESTNSTNETMQMAYFPPPPVILQADGIPPNILDPNDTSNHFPIAGIGYGGSSSSLIAVDVSIQIQSIREIDEADQKIIVEIDLTVHWKDYDFLPEDTSYYPDEMENITSLLQQYSVKPMALDQFEELWKLDIFIERVVKVTKPGLLSTPVTVRVITTTSSIIYTTRASVKVDCNMNFQYYPGDTQNCILDLRSYQHDETKMNLRWNPVPGAYLVNTDTDDNFDLKLSYVAQRKKRVKDINLDDAVFDVLQIQLSMRRRMSYHVIQTYIPSAFLVFITWLSFFIPEDLIEARIGISMTTLLTLTAMFAAVRENTPIVSYVKAIDIWMVYCIFIVFATLLQFTFFVWLRNYKVSKREKMLQNLVCDMPRSNKDNSGINAVGIPRVDEISERAAATFEKTAKVFNKFAFGFFVLNFLIFNLVYWPWLFVSSGHNRWEVNETLNGNPEATNGGFLDEL